MQKAPKPPAQDKELKAQQERAKAEKQATIQEDLGDATLDLMKRYGQRAGGMTAPISGGGNAPPAATPPGVVKGILVGPNRYAFPYRYGLATRS